MAKITLKDLKLTSPKMISSVISLVKSSKQKARKHSKHLNISEFEMNFRAKYRPAGEWSWGIHKKMTF